MDNLSKMNKLNFEIKSKILISGDPVRLFCGQLIHISVIALDRFFAKLPHSIPKTDLKNWMDNVSALETRVSDKSSEIKAKTAIF